MPRDDSDAVHPDPAPAEGQQPAAVGFVGWSGSGKTTLIEGLIAVLRRRTYRVGALKHDAHHFEIEDAKELHRILRIKITDT